MAVWRPRSSAWNELLFQRNPGKVIQAWQHHTTPWYDDSFGNMVGELLAKWGKSGVFSAAGMDLLFHPTICLNQQGAWTGNPSAIPLFSLAMHLSGSVRHSCVHFGPGHVLPGAAGKRIFGGNESDSHCRWLHERKKRQTG
jgi:hypothetical protein